MQTTGLPKGYGFVNYDNPASVSALAFLFESFFREISFLERELPKCYGFVSQDNLASVQAKKIADAYV
jgi:hypothetical protein